MHCLGAAMVSTYRRGYRCGLASTHPPALLAGLAFVPCLLHCPSIPGDVLDGHVIEQLFHARCARLNHTNGMFTLVPLRAALLAAPCEHSASATLQALRREYDQAKASYRTLGRRFQQAMAARNSGSNGGSGGGSDGQQPQLQLLAGACVGCKPFPRPECEEAGYDRSGRDGWPPVGSGEEL